MPNHKQAIRDFEDMQTYTRWENSAHLNPTLSPTYLDYLHSYQDRTQTYLEADEILCWECQGFGGDVTLITCASDTMLGWHDCIRCNGQGKVHGSETSLDIRVWISGANH